MPGKQYKPKCVNDYEFDEVASSMQKMIRRGKEYEAVFWAYILFVSGYGLYIFRRLTIICSEDAPADPMTIVVLNSLHQSYLILHKHNKNSDLYKFLLIVHAVLRLCRAKKTRENDSLLNLINYRFIAGEQLPILDLSIDPHTSKGKSLYGRFDDLEDGKEKDRLDRWYSESSLVENEGYPDKWYEDLKKLRYERAKKNEIRSDE